MKASEIFLEYVAPMQDSTPDEISEAELQKVLNVPLYVWNAVVLDKNPKRRSGDIPQIIREHLKDVGTRHRKIFRDLYRFWVLRKDHYFADCDWPLDVKVYKNVKGALIIRAEVRAVKGVPTPNTPPEWFAKKPLAPVILHPKAQR